MELFKYKLPSGGLNYQFNSLTIKPMTFAQVLEYIENVPSSPIERFYFDYKILLADDPNVNNLLLCDLEYAVFFKKAVTIHKDEEFITQAVCPICEANLEAKINLSRLELSFNKLDEKLLNGMTVDIGGRSHNVRMPTISRFMNIYSKIRRMKRLFNMNIIKLIALFEDSEKFLPVYESLVVNATYQDITVLTMLDNYYYRNVEPIYVSCIKCRDKFEEAKILKIEALAGKEDIDSQLLLKEIYESEYKGVAMGFDDLIANLFWDITANNQLTDSQVVFREIRKDP